MTTITINEVGLRDGLQSLRTVMPTAAKLRWIDSAYAAGVRHMEVASFVPARLLPQMADARQVVAHALTYPDLLVTVLAPNLRGAQDALESGAQRIVAPVSVSTARILMLLTGALLSGFIRDASRGRRSISQAAHAFQHVLSSN